jgi:HPt (histidine-containing phosphotransfer) domain-containing protein
LLQNFTSRHRNTAAKLRLLYRAGDHEQLFLNAHNLKGEAGNGGIDPISQAADVLCQQIKSGRTEQLGELTENLAARCEEALARLQHVAAIPEGHDAADEDQPSPPESLKPMLWQLASQLNAKSFSARGLADEIGELARGTSAAGTIADIGQATRQLRYGDAQTLLQDLLAKYGWEEPS